ncbi:MAG: pilus assembly protein [Candidatus Dormibacteraeota bacterium]|nr:pilus assembly protein [Candidatus Dormibacteraeota bacterium]
MPSVPTLRGRRSANLTFPISPNQTAGSGGPNRAARGQSLVELAVALPILILLLFGIIDFGAVFNSYLEVRSTSREGARLAAVDNGCFPGSYEAATARCTATGAAQLTTLKTDTLSRATGIADRSGLAVTVCYPDNPRVGTDNVTVKITYQAISLTGFFAMLNGVTLESSAMMRLEQTPTFGKDASSCS